MLPKQSIIGDRYTFPSESPNSVISVSHFSLGREALKSRSIRLSAAGVISPLYEAMDRHDDGVDCHRFGSFVCGDLSSDEIRGFFRNERQESDLSDDEATETEDLTQRKYNDLREQAELGNLYAGYRLSRILFDEDSPYFDEYDGACYLESSATRGYSMAQYRLGKMIYDGGYYRRVPENAEYWLTLSAKQNNPYAEMLLGRLYLHGDFLRLNSP